MCFNLCRCLTRAVCVWAQRMCVCVCACGPSPPLPSRWHMPSSTGQSQQSFNGMVSGPWQEGDASSLERLKRSARQIILQHCVHQLRKCRGQSVMAMLWEWTTQCLALLTVCMTPTCGNGSERGQWIRLNIAAPGLGRLLILCTSPCQCQVLPSIHQVYTKATQPQAATRPFMGQPPPPPPGCRVPHPLTPPPPRFTIASHPTSAAPMCL